MLENEPQIARDFLLDVHHEDIANEIYNLIYERAMLGVALGVVTVEVAQTHLAKIQAELSMEPLVRKGEDET